MSRVQSWVGFLVGVAASSWEGGVLHVKVVGQANAGDVEHPGHAVSRPGTRLTGWTRYLL
jgi:hypothetical protein